MLCFIHNLQALYFFLDSTRCIISIFRVNQSHPQNISDCHNANQSRKANQEPHQIGPVLSTILLRLLLLWATNGTHPSAHVMYPQHSAGWQHSGDWCTQQHQHLSASAQYFSVPLLWVRDLRSHSRKGILFWTTPMFVDR